MEVTKCDQFLALLKKSQILDEEKLAEAKEAAADAENATAAAKALIRKGLVSRWQASQLLAGRSVLSLGKYRLIELLGRGGMGNVFLAEHVTMNRRVALKTVSRQLARDKAALDRFLAEARAIAALDHPSIVQAYSVDNEGDRYYIVMEYVAGKNLQQVVEDDGPLDFERAANYIMQAADGLAHAHDKGMIHCDIKPANLLVNDQGIVKILDMGLARLSGKDAKAGEGSDERVLGSVDYLAPEQGMNADNLDGRADIYSLGCTLYFLLTGRPPFPEGTLHEKIVKHQSAKPAPLAELRDDVPEDLAAVCAKMMAKKPKDRYQSAEEIVDALSEWTEPQRRLKGMPLGDGAAPAFSLNVDPSPLAARAAGKTKAKKETKPEPAKVAEESTDEDDESPAAVPASGSRRKMLLIGGAVAAVLLLIGLGVGVGLMIGGGGTPPTEADGATAAAAGQEAPVDDAAELDVLDDGLGDLDTSSRSSGQNSELASAMSALAAASDDASADAAAAGDAATQPAAADTPSAAADSAAATETAPAESAAPAPAGATPGDSPPAAETPKPAEESKPAETPKPAEPAKPKEPPKPKDPFEKFPKFFALPLLDPKAEPSAQARGPFDLGQVFAREEAPWDLELAGGELAFKGSKIFTLNQIEEDPPAWMVRLESKGSGGDAQDVAKLWVERPTLKFQWAESADPITANYFRNCLLKVDVDGQIRPLPLFQTQIVEPLTLDNRRGMLKAEVPLEYAPSKEMLYLEISSADKAYPITTSPDGLAPLGTPITILIMRTARGNNVVEAVGFRGTPMVKTSGVSMSFRMQLPGAGQEVLQRMLPQWLRLVPGANPEERLQGVVDGLKREREKAEKAYNEEKDHNKKAERGQAVELIDQQLWYVEYSRAADSGLKLHFKVVFRYDDETSIDFARTQ